MSRLRDFALPDLGEGLTEGEILQWMVKAGDTVTLNQPIVEVETAKAAVEVPSPFAGVVTVIHHEAGTTVDVGAVIISFDTDPSAGPLEAAAGVAAAGAFANPVESAAVRPTSAVGDHPEVGDLVPRLPDPGPSTSGPSAREPGQEQGALIGEVGPTGRTATLVGYGPRSVTAVRRARVAAAPAGPAAADPAAAGPAGPVAADPAATGLAAGLAAAGLAAARSAGAVAVLAKPPVRRLARELGIDLALLNGTGAGGTITRGDVDAAAAGAPTRAGGDGGAAPAFDPAGRVATYDPAGRDATYDPAGRGATYDPAGRGATYDPVTRERRIPVKGVRKLTAQAMVGSAFTAPHVTEFITLDVTPTMELVQRLKALPELAGVKVTPLLLVAKALLLAVKRNPEVNATFTEDEIVVKDYVHLGIAAATPRGLLVPNIKDADAMSLVELAGALQDLVATARDGRTSPADMARGTITITNVGVFGVDNGTPILNPGEAAILCFGAVRPMPWVVDGEIVVRQVTQLALSFDHRCVDGQLGSQFLADIARVLADPTTALAWS